MAKLNTAARKKLSGKVFGLPEERAYPMPDESHARNALARASEYASPEQKKKIRAKAHELFPGMKMRPLSDMAKK